MPCSVPILGMPWAAESCNGVRKGRLDDATDDAKGELSYIDLGEGARLTILGINGFTADGAGMIGAEQAGVKLGHTLNGDENARSWIALVQWGNFRLLQAADLSGVDDLVGGPDMETFVAGRGPGMLFVDKGAKVFGDSLGLDVLHLGHHAEHTSTNPTWVDWLMPPGQNRNAIFGAHPAYSSADQEPLDRVTSRLGTGFIWANRLGSGDGKSDRLRVADGNVIVTVGLGGDRYSIQTEPRDASPGDAGIDAGNAPVFFDSIQR
jgi:hypothetical protein